MRLGYILIFLLIGLIGKSQIIDDFSDGDFANNPTWSGDSAKFTIDLGSLRSNSTTASDVFYLSTNSSAAIDTEWEFWVNMKFSTSSANYTDFYLISDTADLVNANDGYFVRVGNTDDEVSLYQIDGGTETEIIDGPDDQTHNKQIRIRVLRQLDGDFSLSADYTGGFNYNLIGNVSTTNHQTSKHFGVKIKQSTASFHQKHFFDDFYVGPIRLDTIPPAIIEHSISDTNEIEIVFSEELMPPFATDFDLSNGYGNPSSLNTIGSTVSLTYSSKFVNGTYQLDLTNIRDEAGNSFDTTLLFIVSSFGPPSAGQVLINEIYPDPFPLQGLPGEEYVELFNASNDTINLKKCAFSDGASSAIFSDVVLFPDSFLIICEVGNESLFASFGNVQGLSSFPTLNNTGDNLVLLDTNGQIIDSVSYTDDFYQDASKEDGGYSIERVSVSTNCPAIQNWAASLNTFGGTPGKQNSWFGIRLDSIAPQIVSTEIIVPSAALELVLTEIATENLMLQLDNFTILETGENATFAYSLAAPKYVLEFPSVFEESVLYHLEIGLIEDCHGNSSSNVVTPLIVGSEPAKGDLVINEILFNPPTNGVDFIELYNTSDKFFDLSRLQVAKIEDGVRGDVKPISTQPNFIYPNHFALLTEDTSRTKRDYSNTVSSALVQVPDLPSMNNDRDTIVLLNNGILIDSVFYDDDYHFELLTSTDGVSLERLSYSNSSTYEGNWHSASASVGFATPGYINSQFVDLAGTNAQFELESPRISPDGDSYEDLLILNYTMDSPGYTINGSVFDLAGRYVSQAFNSSLSTTGIITWDGILENGSKASVGNYILLLEAFDLNGKVVKKKLAFAVVSNF